MLADILNAEVNLKAVAESRPRVLLSQAEKGDPDSTISASDTRFLSPPD